MKFRRNFTYLDGFDVSLDVDGGECHLEFFHGGVIEHILESHLTQLHHNPLSRFGAPGDDHLGGVHGDIQLVF